MKLSELTERIERVRTDYGAPGWDPDVVFLSPQHRPGRPDLAWSGDPEVKVEVGKVVSIRLAGGNYKWRDKS